MISGTSYQTLILTNRLFAVKVTYMNIFLQPSSSILAVSHHLNKYAEVPLFDFQLCVHIYLFIYFVLSTRNCGNPSVMSAVTGIRPWRQQQAKPGVPDVRLPSNISPLAPGGSQSIQARWETYIIPPVSSGSSPSWPCPEDLNEEASSLIRCPDHLNREEWS